MAPAPVKTAKALMHESPGAETYLNIRVCRHDTEETVLELILIFWPHDVVCVKINAWNTNAQCRGAINLAVFACDMDEMMRKQMLDLLDYIGCRGIGFISNSPSLIGAIQYIDKYKRATFFTEICINPYGNL